MMVRFMETLRPHLSPMAPKIAPPIGRAMNVMPKPNQVATAEPLKNFSSMKLSKYA